MRVVQLLKNNLDWMGDWKALDEASRCKSEKVGGWSGNCKYTYGREV